MVFVVLKETKANNTWPGPVKHQQQQLQQQQQPWGKNMMAAPGVVEPSVMPSHLHPPLQMQWSDPLTNRPLTTWGSGMSSMSWSFRTMLNPVNQLRHALHFS